MAYVRARTWLTAPTARPTSGPGTHLHFREVLLRLPLTPAAAWCAREPDSIHTLAAAVPKKCRWSVRRRPTRRDRHLRGDVQAGGSRPRTAPGSPARITPGQRGSHVRLSIGIRALEAAHGRELCDGYVLTTATADWTTYETIGGLRPTGPNTLDFEEGHFLKAIRANQWLVIDELNRSHFDRAFGQLFTVLSGQPVVLPYHRPEAGPGKPLVLVPEGVPSPLPDADVLEIPQSWRVLATMNVFDKTLLFEMSFALMRRFAFIEVASPSASVFDSLIEQQAADPEAAALAKKLLPLRELKDLGPAVFMDLAKFLRERLVLDHADEGQLLFEAFYSYLLPQFEGIDAAAGERLFQTLSPLMGSAARRNRLRDTLNSVLGLELQPPPPAQALVDESDDEDVEQPDE